MAFLKIDGLDLGMTYGYSITPKSQDKKIRMASGNLVTEKRGSKWEIKVTYKYLTEAQRITLYSKLENVPANGMAVEFYAPSGALSSGLFAVSSVASPKIAKFNGNVPEIWSDIGFTLEEV